MNNDNFFELNHYHCIKINIDLAALTDARELGKTYIARNAVSETIRYLSLYLNSNDAYLGSLRRDLDDIDQVEVEFKYKDKDSCKGTESDIKLIFQEMMRKSDNNRDLKGVDLYPDNYYQIFNSLLLQNKMQSNLPIKDEINKKPKI